MSRRRWGTMLLAWSGLLAVGALAAWLRYRLVEPPALGERCAVATLDGWCTLRGWVVAGFLGNAFGYAALAAGACALLRQRAWTAWLAAALGAFALQLYCYQSGALALLVGTVLLVRGAPRRQQHGETGQHIQAQP
ncbi:hypothetical protein ACO2Q2_08700 [Dyella sp. KRB-257]|uniref:hypothetical protein n=1 Tax=Dyella sp. KRB-257 TaxID=3400915 RepID=UPI003BFB0B7D